MAPYGISAELVGFAFDQKNEEELAMESETWSNFYPLRFHDEQDSGLSCTAGLPFFAMVAPSTQSTRLQGPHKFNACRKRTLDNSTTDVTPKFVEVIVSKYFGHLINM